MDFKYDILKHPNVAFTTDGKEKIYLHGGTENAIGTIIIDEDINNYKFENEKEIKKLVDEYELVSSDDIDEYFK